CARDESAWNYVFDYW
nr:immunoglobulin heavy chain junction region [Macaca mulatta]MOX67386.1 immunoglobulin heavy chain junction region [Macaca mulatta]